MPRSDSQQNGFSPSPRAVGPQMICSPALPTAIPATINGGGNWQSGVIMSEGWKSIAVGAKLSQTGQISIQRYLDDAGTIPVGAAITAALVANTANWATVNDGVVWASCIVTISNTSGSSGNLTNTAVIFGAS